MNINLKNVPKEGEKEDHYFPFITKNISNQNELSIFASKYRKIIHPRERESINQKIVPKKKKSGSLFPLVMVVAVIHNSQVRGPIVANDG